MANVLKSCGKHDIGFLWSIQNAMAFLRVSRPTLYRWMDQGFLSWVSVDGRRFITQAEIDRVNAERSKEEGVSDE